MLIQHAYNHLLKKWINFECAELMYGGNITNEWAYIEVKMVNRSIKRPKWLPGTLFRPKLLDP